MKCVLVVDDDHEIRVTLSEILRDEGYVVIEAEGGKMALNELATRQIDLILLDLNLPRKDGRVVLADFKSDPTLSSIPVVVFTTSHSRKDIARSYELGANCYVSKPGSLDEFREAVQSIEQFWLRIARLPE